MSIKSVGRYLYEVPSGSNPGAVHLCDLTANGGAGKCSCVDHGTRRQPALDKGIPALTAPTLCKHLRAAYWHFLREVMPVLAEQESKPKRET